MKLTTRGNIVVVTFAMIIFIAVNYIESAGMP